jgi:hypothetical protein
VCGGFGFPRYVWRNNVLCAVRTIASIIFTKTPGGGSLRALFRLCKCRVQRVQR